MYRQYSAHQQGLVDEEATAKCCLLQVDYRQDGRVRDHPRIKVARIGWEKRQATCVNSRFASAQATQTSLHFPPSASISPVNHSILLNAPFEPISALQLQRHDHEHHTTHSAGPDYVPLYLSIPPVFTTIPLPFPPERPHHKTTLLDHAIAVDDRQVPGGSTD